MTERWPTQAECDSFYGNPRNRSGQAATPAWESANLVRCVPPWQMIDEDDGTPINDDGITIHRKCRDSLARIFDKAWALYGQSQAEIEPKGQGALSKYLSVQGPSAGTRRKAEIQIRRERPGEIQMPPGVD